MGESFMELFCGSPFLDDNLTWYTEDPDVTPCFQKTVLAWLPCVVLGALTPVEAYYFLCKCKGFIPCNWLNMTKLVICGLLFVLNITDLIFTIYQASQDFEVFLVDYWTPVIKAATFLLCAVLIHYNRRSGLRTSGPQFVFWLLSALLGAVQFRYQIRRAQLEDPPDPYFPVVTYILCYVLVLAMLVMYFIPDSPPIKSPFPPVQKPCPWLAASFPARLFFSWLDGFVWKGYRTPLKDQDMWDLIPENTANHVVTEFQKHWQRSLSVHADSAGPQAMFNHNSGSIDFAGGKAKKKQPSFLPALCKMFGLVFLAGSAVRVVADFLPFINPQLLSQLIAFVGSDEPMWHGFVYAGLMLVASILQTLVNSHFQFHMFVIGLKARTAIISIIYQKALRMSSGARKESTVGEIVNLMAVDANRIIEVTMHLNMCLTAPLVIGMSLYFLWQILGPSVLAGLVFMVILVPVNSYIARKVKSLQIRQMKSKDVRLRMMNEILNGIRVLKLYAWEPSYEQEIYKIRDKEVKVLKEAAYFNAATSFIWSCAPFLVSLVTFATYVLVDEHNILDAQKAFVSLSLFNIMRMPLMMIPMVMNSLIQAHVAFKRINRYLRAEELDLCAVTHDNEKSPLIVEKGVFAWGRDEAPVLTDISMRVNEAELVAVVGTVGAGKSSLISALLGEMDRLSGRVNTRGSMAYVPQQAWIQNASLKDNIMFGRAPDNQRYQQVVEACALLPDFKVLPGGDETEIGEKGINLSGGQKQRVSLARAVYNNCDVYLLDDPLSAVDSHVGKHIFEKVIGPTGMLKNKTRLLVTHGITYLPEVDDIIVLKDGQISERGTYKQLVNKKGAFAEFLELHLQEIVENDATSEADFEELKQQLEGDLGTDEFQRKLSRAISKVSESRSLSGSIGDTQSLRRRFSVASTKSGTLSASRSGSRSHLNKVPAPGDKPAPVVGRKLIEAEKAEVGSVKWDVYKHYMKSIGFILMLATLIFNAVFQGFQVGSNLWLTVWSENSYGTMNATTNLTETTPQDLYLSVYGVLGVGQVVSTCIATLAISIGTINAATLLHNGMLANILRLPQSLFDTTPVGRILTRFSSDVNVLDTMFPMIIRASIPNIYRVAATFVVIIYSTPIFIAIFIPLSVVYYFMQRVYVATSRQMKRLESVTRAPVYSHFGESITGAPIIRAYGVQEKFIKDSEMKVDYNQMCVFPSHACSSWLAIRLETIGSLIIFFSSLFAVLARDTMNAGFVGLSVSYAMQITNTLNMLVRMASDIETNIVAVERIKEYSEYEQEPAWEKPNEQVTSDWPTGGKVEFRNYQLRYREGLPLVLKGINFTIQGGEKVGIVGRTGAGKSSLTLALFRIIEAAGGAILIDDVDIATLGLHTLRSRITIIPQDPVLFSGTLRKNLDPFERVSDDALWAALEHAHLRAFVKGLPTGLSHEVSEGGENLSVGQRQLICLARALLRKTKVLVLDEATAAVDLETDDLIQATIRKEFKDCTVLTIAHRLNTIVDSDRVIVLDDGRVIEYDSPDALLQNKESVFHGMAKDAGIV
ncbi:multidrug resistance-associated protein 1-like [Bacillus rossius redtenbacheri]|uniref:multidrug resistance-associated protein 1-like n=1 Tax=Bacillus rossius redtenbacheri TaxID=93214 RepID=UPI002FDD7AE6